MLGAWSRWGAVPRWLAAGRSWACSCPRCVAFLGLALLAPQVAQAEGQRYAESFAGEVAAGETFSRSFGPALELALLPAGGGWEIAVRQAASDENLARLTPPLHFLPNPRYIEPWHLMPAPPACTVPDPQQGPGPRREFVFSRAVGTTIAGPDARQAVTPEEVEQIRRDGQGVLEILSADPGPVRDGCPSIGRLRFRVDLFGRR